MPVIQGAASDRHRLVRMMRVVRGQMRFVMDCQPGFDYGRKPHKTEITESGVMFHGDDGLDLALHLVRRPGVAPSERVQPTPHGVGVRAVISAVAGDVGGIVLDSAPDGPPRELLPEEVVRLYEDTRDFWRGWVARSRYRGRCGSTWNARR